MLCLTTFSCQHGHRPRRLPLWDSTAPLLTRSVSGTRQGPGRRGRAQGALSVQWGSGRRDRTQWSARGHTGQRVAAGERGPRRGLGDRGGAVGQRPQGRATRRRGVWGTPCGLRELHRSRDRAGPGRGPRGQRLRLCCWRGQMMCTGVGPVASWSLMSQGKLAGQPCSDYGVISFPCQGQICTR